MKCDNVFDILTRGPFPTGDPSDAAVERHLAACHDCRQLAEALRPAVELFHESISSDEVDSLPGYRGVLCEVERTSAVMTAISESSVEPARTVVEQHAPQQDGRKRWEFTWRFATALLFMIGLGIGIWFSNPEPGLPQAGRTSAASDRFQPDENGREILLSIGLSSECLPLGTEWDKQTTHTLAHLEMDCCTRCHTVSNPNRPDPDSVAMLGKSCEACHGL